MAQFFYQEQEQEDLLADFDAPLFKKEVRNSAIFIEKECKNSVKYHHPIIEKPSKVMVDDFEDPSKAMKKPTKAMEEPSKVMVDDFQFDDEYIPISLLGLAEEINAYVSKHLERLRYTESVDTMLERVVKAGEIAREAVYRLPTYEHELKYLTAVGLMCYGGSWAYLAGFIAAVEIFDTVKVLEDGCSVCSTPFSEISPGELDVTPGQIKESIREMGLQCALMVVVAMSPACAEICLVIAFASRIKSHISVKEALKKFYIQDIYVADNEDWLNHLDDGWLQHISFLVAFILSLIVYGCFPQLILAMYMCSFGLSMLLETFSDEQDVFVLWLPLGGDFAIDLFTFDASSWTGDVSKWQKWGLIATMALWQAWYAYSGTFQFLSWLMFTLPAAQLYRLVRGEAEGKDKIE